MPNEQTQRAREEKRKDVELKTEAKYESEEWNKDLITGVRTVTP